MIRGDQNRLRKTFVELLFLFLFFAGPGGDCFKKELIKTCINKRQGGKKNTKIFTRGNVGGKYITAEVIAHVNTYRILFGLLNWIFKS